jgi:ribosome-associated translation inhibitor RaiA
VEIIFQAHNAVIPDTMRARAERAVHRIAARLRRAVDAIVRFEQDGPRHRVVLTLRVAGRRAMLAEGEATTFGPALAAAAARAERQLAHRKRTRRDRGRELARA